MKVYFASPLYGVGVDPDIYENHLLLVMSSHGAFGGIACPKNRLMPYARNEAVESVLNDPYIDINEDYIFWIDQDVIVAPGVVTRLLSHRKDIVTGLYFQKEPPHFPLIMKKRESQKSERGVYSNLSDYPEGLVLLEDGAIGFGCVLTRLSIFTAIPKPWFDWTKDSGEDIDFCIKAREYGFQIWYDTEILCGHQENSRKVVTYDNFKQFRGRELKPKGE